MSQFERTSDRPEPAAIGPWSDVTPARQALAVQPQPGLFERIALVALVAVMGVTAVGLGLILAESELSNESQAFASDAVEAITLHWDEGALLSRATPGLAAQAQGQLDPLFTGLRVSAADAANQGCKGGAGIDFHGLADPALIAAYDCPLATRNGATQVHLGLNKVAGAWRIDRFTVAPPPKG
jgi:hypothetical protein